MSNVELEEYYGVCGHYIKHELKLLKFPTLIIYYSCCRFVLVCLEPISDLELIQINQMDVLNFFLFLIQQPKFRPYSVDNLQTHAKIGT